MTSRSSQNDQILVKMFRLSFLVKKRLDIYSHTDQILVKVFWLGFLVEKND